MMIGMMICVTNPCAHSFDMMFLHYAVIFASTVDADIDMNMDVDIDVNIDIDIE